MGFLGMGLLPLRAGDADRVECESELQAARLVERQQYHLPSDENHRFAFENCQECVQLGITRIWFSTTRLTSSY